MQVKSWRQDTTHTLRPQTLMLWSLDEEATIVLSQLTAKSVTSVSCPRHAISSIPVCSPQICRQSSGPWNKFCVTSGDSSVGGSAVSGLVCKRALWRIKNWQHLPEGGLVKDLQMMELSFC